MYSFDSSSDSSLHSDSSLFVLLNRLRNNINLEYDSALVQVALDFEKHWTPTRENSIESYLEKVPQPDQEQLFFQLLRIDYNLRHETGNVLSQEGYEKRFPQWKARISSFFEQANQESQEVNRSRIGHKYGNYRIKSILGQGGMGIVYKAVDELFNWNVAIKFMRSKYVANPNAIKQFINEIRLLGKIDCNNLFIRPLGYHKDSDNFYFVMEYVEGQNLAEYVLCNSKPHHSDNNSQSISNNRGLPESEVISYAYQIICGLKNIHEQGIVHRDIKPQNIMRTLTGKIKILDLGLGIVNLSQQDTPSIPEENNTSDNSNADKNLFSPVGTLDYMAPECFDKSTVLDQRADIYSLGRTIVYLLTAQSPSNWQIPVLDESKPTISLTEYFKSLNVMVSSKLTSILEEMLHRNPEQRIQTTALLQERFEELIDSSHTTPAVQKQTEHPTIHWLITTVLLLFTIGLAGFSIYQHFQMMKINSVLKQESKIAISNQTKTGLIPVTKGLLLESVPDNCSHRPVPFVIFDDNCESVYGITENGHILRWSLQTGKFLSQKQSSVMFNKPISYTDIAYNAQRAIIRHSQYQFSVFDSRFNVIQTFKNNSFRYWFPIINQTGTEVAIGASVHEFARWDIETKKLIQKITTPKGCIIKGCCYNPDNSLIACCIYTRPDSNTSVSTNATEQSNRNNDLWTPSSFQIHIWKTSLKAPEISSQETQLYKQLCYTTFEKEVIDDNTRIRNMQLEFSPDGKKLVICLRLVTPLSKNILLKDIPPSKRKKFAKNKLTQLYKESISDIYSEGIQIITIWDIESGKRLYTHREADRLDHTSIAWSPDSKNLGLTNSCGELKILNLPSNKIILPTVVNGKEFCTSIIADPSIDFYIVGKSKLKFTKNKSEPTTLKQLRENNWDFHGMLWSRDGKYIVSGSEYNTIYLWEVVSP